jgi:hypothetical protein
MGCSSARQTICVTEMYRPLDIEINCRDLLQPLQP